MAALGEMAAVAQAQASLAEQVQRRMQQIDGLLQPAEEAKTGGASAGSSAAPGSGGHGGGPLNGDEEVDYWRRKIESLSAPVEGTSESPSFPDMQSLRREADLIHAEAKPSPSHYSSSPEVSSYKRSAKGSPNVNLRRAEDKSSPGMSFVAQSKRSPGASVAPSARLSQELHGDAEVDYWRRKIAELSTPVPGTSPTQKRSASGTQSRSHTRTRLQEGTRLADEPLSWEGTQSFAEENLKTRHAESK
uniref:Uncharacterized protein n=2 Tax=Rhizochromulina marina TaxID=1034831 RepID=A0A7S2SR48_9STRA